MEELRKGCTQDAARALVDTVSTYHTCLALSFVHVIHALSHQWLAQDTMFQALAANSSTAAAAEPEGAGCTGDVADGEADDNHEHGEEEPPDGDPEIPDVD